MQDTITPLVSRIAELKAQIAPLEAQIKPLADELDKTKFELMLAMQQSKSKRTEAVNGYYVVRAERQNVSIADEAAVSEWLEARGFDLAEYYKLDATRIKAAAEAAMKSDGEIVPGVQVSSTEYLTIKEAK